MARHDFMKEHLRATLMELCERTPLDKVTATQIIQAAGVARKSFYYHFSDLDDLVSYAAFKPLDSGKFPAFSKENFQFAWAYCVQHRAFFGQLPRQRSQNNFRAAFIAWLRDSLMSLFADVPLDDGERAFRGHCVTLYCHGSVDLLMEWLEAGLPEPYDAYLDATWAMMPPFFAEAADGLPYAPQGRPH